MATPPLDQKERIMNWLLSLLGVREPEPLEEPEVITLIAEQLREFEGDIQKRKPQVDDDLAVLYPEALAPEYEIRARKILEIVQNLRNHREVSRTARETIEKLKSFCPIHEQAIFDVDELTSKVKVTYTTPRGSAIILQSRTKSALAVEELLLDTNEHLGHLLRIS